MYSKQKKSQVCLIIIVELISMGFWLSGIIILGVASKQKCGSGCVEKSCLSINYDYYPCDCVYTCQSKSVVTDSVYSLGVALLIIGIIGSITGSILFCTLRRRFYRMQPSIRVPVIVAGGMPLQGEMSFQGGMPLQGGMPFQGGMTHQGIISQQWMTAQNPQQGIPGYTYAQGIATNNNPSLNYAPQNYFPQNYPPQIYAPQNYASQNYAQQNLPPVLSYGIPVQGQIPELSN